jgi:hypothetical protein
LQHGQGIVFSEAGLLQVQLHREHQVLLHPRYDGLGKQL